MTRLDAKLFVAATDGQRTIRFGNHSNRKTIGVGGGQLLGKIPKFWKVEKRAHTVRLEKCLPIGNSQRLLCKSRIIWKVEP